MQKYLFLISSTLLLNLSLSSSLIKIKSLNPLSFNSLYLSCKVITKANIILFFKMVILSFLFSFNKLKIVPLNNSGLSLYNLSNSLSVLFLISLGIGFNWIFSYILFFISSGNSDIIFSILLKTFS